MAEKWADTINITGAPYGNLFMEEERVKTYTHWPLDTQGFTMTMALAKSGFFYTGIFIHSLPQPASVARFDGLSLIGKNSCMLASDSRTLRFIFFLIDGCLTSFLAQLFCVFCLRGVENYCVKLEHQVNLVLASNKLR